MMDKKNSLKKTGIIIFVLFLIACMAIGGYWATFDLMGKKALDAEDYETAAKKLEYSLLSQDTYKEAVILAAEECEKNGRYQSALDYCQKLNDDALYIDMLVRIADQCIRNGDDKAALAYYEDAADRSATVQTEDQYKTLCSELGEKLLASENYDEALTFFQKPGVSKEQNQEILVYIASKCIEHEHYAAACEYYKSAEMENSVEYTYAQGMGHVCNIMESSDDISANIKSAAEALNDAWFRDLEDYETDFPYAYNYYRILDDISQYSFLEAWSRICAEDFPGDKDDWKKIFYNIWKSWDNEWHLDAAEVYELSGIVDDAILNSGNMANDYSKESFAELAHDAFARSQNLFPSWRYPEKSATVHKDELGSNANKKVLVVRETYHSWEIDFDLTSKLPFEWQPANLEEVEYVLVLKYDEKLVGWYGGQIIGVRAIQHTGQTQIYSTTRGSQVFYSKTVKGPMPPDEINYNSANKPYQTSGGIDMKDATVDALEHLEQFLEWE